MTKEVVDRFKISVAPVDTCELLNDWETYKEAHNGFDNYIAYEFIYMKKKYRKTMDKLKEINPEVYYKLLDSLDKK